MTLELYFIDNIGEKPELVSCINRSASVIVVLRENILVIGDILQVQRN